MKTLVVGDLHGNWEIAQKCLGFDGNIIFVGDYVDSFTRTTEDSIKTLRMILKACESRDNVIALYGNHEMSYCGHPCSGYKAEIQACFDILSLLIAENFKYYTWINDTILVSHAGVSNTLLQSSGETLEDYLTSDSFHQVGRSRGGWSQCGGLLWCDWFSEFEPIPDVPQIVGHSGYRPFGEYKQILKNGNSYNIDNFECGGNEVIIVDDECNIKIKTLDDL